MKKSYKQLLVSLLIPVLTGGVSALLSSGGIRDFATVAKPPLTPPPWVFGVVWTVLYLLMGLASYRTLTSGGSRSRIQSAQTVYGLQLAVNFFWSILFFNFKAYWVSFVWLALLWVLILTTLIRFFRLRREAGWLLLPYLVWVTLAGYLNAGVALLN